MNIACDIDGVIAMCGQSMIDYNIRKGIVPEGTKLEDFRSYRIESMFPNFSVECLDDPDFWINIPLFQKDSYVGDAEKFVKELHRCGELIFVSACFMREARNAWIKKHNLHPDGFVSVSSKDKPQYAKDNRFDIFIEDHPHTIKYLCEIGVPYVYAVEHHYKDEHGVEYNLSGLKYKNLRVVGNLDEILEDIKYVTGRSRIDRYETHRRCVA